MRGNPVERWVERIATSDLLVSAPGDDPQHLVSQVRRVTIVVVVMSNVIGAAVVAAFSAFVLATPDLGNQGQAALRVNLLAAMGYFVFAVVAGIIWGLKAIDRGDGTYGDWLMANQPPSLVDRNRIVRNPQRIMSAHLMLWGLAALVFGLLNLAFDVRLAFGVGATVALGGITTSAAAYLVAELALRPITSRALSAGAVDRKGVPGVTARIARAWAFGTGVPIVGLLFAAIYALTTESTTKVSLAVTAIVLTSVGLVFGALVTMLAAYATIHPLASIRRGLVKVEQGDYGFDLPVWDTTEIGELQRQFNLMIEGLRERERVRDLFGRQVGANVAAQSIQSGVRLGGTLQTVAVLFVDIVGSTALATREHPVAVVNLLNRFFAIAVECTADAGGFVNKFEGDATLSVFGAPEAIADPAGSALRAARRIRGRLQAELPQVKAAIGVAYGDAVAGHVGAVERFEYTVIGDPVNQASRLCELAKEYAELVAASGESVQAANVGEQPLWRSAGSHVLRGRGVPSEVFVPRRRPDME